MMSLSTLAILILSQLALAAGEVCLKYASGSEHFPPANISVRATWFAIGIAAMAAWFFLWLHLMHFFELNRLFAFEGVSPLLIAVASALFLSERISVRAWFASFLIAIGITLVALF
ncbi:MAG TPA: EamA family transporter [Chthoniobacterales bacterium]|nr:EamA family transporter [Chthoniobacterales bacterium]